MDLVQELSLYLERWGREGEREGGGLGGWEVIYYNVRRDIF